MTEKLWAPVEGKYGRTREGRKEGPMLRIDDLNFPFRSGFRSWTSSGAFLWGNCPSLNDLVSEWRDDQAPEQSILIDPAKIRVGDSVRISGVFEVQKVDLADPIRTIRVALTADRVFWLSSSMIVEHIPAVRQPEPIEVGCRAFHLHWSSPVNVLAINGEDAWILTDHGMRVTVKVCHLTRINDDRAPI